MKKLYGTITISLIISLLLTSCNAKSSTESSTTSISETTVSSTTIETALATETVTEIDTEIIKKEFAPEMLEVEKESILVGKLSLEHEFYQEVISLDPECAEYINEISIYDEEIDDTFIVHLSLPPEYDSSKEYPMIIMTDGVWRLSDHPELRPLMKNGEIEQVIMVSIGYPNGYDYRKIRERDLVNDPESYLHFIVDNLVPYLSEQYSVDSENMTLTGHSYGGYWGFFALFNSDTIAKNIFKNYYIGSPSFQSSTDGDYISDFEDEYYQRNKTLNCNVYVTVGGNEINSFEKPIKNFVKFLEDRDYEGLNLTYEIIDGYGHDTVFKPSIKNTMLMFYGKNE